MEDIPNKNRHFMLSALEVKPSALPPQDPYTQWSLLLIVVLLFNCF